ALAFVLERQRDPRAECQDLAVFDSHVHFGHFRDAQIAQRPGRGRYRAPAGVLPRGLADPDDVHDPVNMGIRSLLGLGHRISSKIYIGQTHDLHMSRDALASRHDPVGYMGPFKLSYTWMGL